ncbi:MULTISPECIES: hypothetical protein [unclassified Pseudoclavibacter]|uniref:hypothetical protein n=1 Tax=unclassified Pseudoclavibacter TaxID=2615177 RepID=UPI0011B06161|nr:MULTISPECIES: hypothetical protein [unclassified Pseudoclavibacter]
MIEILSSGYAQTLALVVRRAYEAGFVIQRKAKTEVIALWWLVGLSAVLCLDHHRAGQPPADSRELHDA